MAGDVQKTIIQLPQGNTTVGGRVPIHQSGVTHQVAIGTAAYANNDQLVASGGTDGQVLTRTSTGGQVWTNPATGGSANAVVYTEQTLTPEQQERARINIGAEAVLGEITPIYSEVFTAGDGNTSGTGYSTTLGFGTNPTNLTLVVNETDYHIVSVRTPTSSLVFSVLPNVEDDADPNNAIFEEFVLDIIDESTGSVLFSRSLSQAGNDLGPSSWTFSNPGFVFTDGQIFRVALTEPTGTRIIDANRLPLATSITRGAVILAEDGDYERDAPATDEAATPNGVIRTIDREVAGDENGSQGVGTNSAGEIVRRRYRTSAGGTATEANEDDQMVSMAMVRRLIAEAIA